MLDVCSEPGDLSLHETANISVRFGKTLQFLLLALALQAPARRDRASTQLVSGAQSDDLGGDRDPCTTTRVRAP
jgi:hypothetical protein